ncbi:MAG: phage holin family protein [Verrucomicrobiota bacterium]
MLAFVNALAAFVESRLALLGKESKAAAAQLLGLLACLVAALLFFALGYTFLIVGAIAGIARLLQVSWLSVTLAAAGIHFVLVLIFLLGARGIVKRPMFREFKTELGKDREWLKNLDESSHPTK